ncbi:helix-turn-helix transcriptional regulator [Thermoanaerobacterium thermosaccharolyticum]|uniref:helix-turn-helix transcriptional regulator n=1 Tax=Thermoanaerobacterium thermosaccharolyticum TaxID=1517 RepID=UPI0020A548BE|nr:WYL domain-containing protein [Thermoanaerobacterium thermosaccharolyticum]MCP2239404.1 proteasome accessory factor B [Thermoanaerobacterium thermosaccharolyticum]
MIKNGDSTQLERQWKILSILSWENNGMTINQIYQRLAKNFGEEVSTKTIKRDLDDLTMVFPIYEEGEGRGTTYTLEKYKIHDFIFSVQELFALFFTREIIRKYDTSEIGKMALNFIERIISYIPSIYDDYIDRLYRTFLIQKDIDSDKNVTLDMLETINDAIIYKKSIKMRYYSFTSDTETEREVDPYLIYEKEGHYYLTGFCKLHNEIRDFRISRIKKIKLLDKSFEISPNFDKSKYYKYTWNILKGSTKYRVQIRFVGNAARLVKEYEGYRADEIVENNDGSILFIKVVSQLDEIKRWVLGFGCEAEVISPDVFKDMVNGEIIKMAKKIRSE